MKILLKSYFFYTLFSIIACQKSELTIPKDKMLDILTDVTMAEAHIQNASPENKDSITHVMYDKILSIHQMDKERYRTEMMVISRDPKLTQEYFKEVKKRIERMRTKLE